MNRHGGVVGHAYEKEGVVLHGNHAAWDTVSWFESGPCQCPVITLGALGDSHLAV